MAQSIHYPGVGQMKYEVAYVSNVPESQVIDTIGLMNRYAVEDAKRPEVIQDAMQAIGEGNGGNLLDGVFNYVKRSLTFREDVDTLDPIRPGMDDVEALIRPIDVSLMKRAGIQVYGDCDDFAMYTASLLTALGIPCGFCTIAADPSTPDIYSHVYVVALVGGKQIPMDTSHGPGVGWQKTDGVGRRRIWPVDSFRVCRAKLIVLLAALAALSFLEVSYAS